MNNKGQSLVLFLLILPIIVSFLAFFIDLSLVTYRKSKMEGIIESNLHVILDKEIKDEIIIKDILKENNLDNVDILLNEEDITIKTNLSVKSIFGKILKFDIYHLKVIFKGNYVDKKVSKIR